MSHRTSLRKMAMWRGIGVATVLILLAPGSHSQLDVCGRPALNARIVGGQNAPEGYWPWQAIVLLFGKYRDGGSLINNKWVLSAAATFSTSFPASYWEVYVGIQSIEDNDPEFSTRNPNQQIRGVARIIIHPSFNIENHDNDIALLELTSTVSFTNYVLPVCLAAAGSTFHTGTRSWVTGFATLSEGSSVLHEKNVPVVGDRQCKCKNDFHPINGDKICTGSVAGDGLFCPGDAGNPMVSKQGSVWVQSGVVGSACSQAFQHFTRVSHYEAWITSLITTNTPGFVRFSSSGVDSDNNFTCPGTQPATTQPPTNQLPTTTQPPTSTQPPTTTAAELCGKPALNTRIVGGQNAPEGNWPWQASLHLNGGLSCGGSLINNKWVLSAAHCFAGSSDPTSWLVYLGRQFSSGNNPNEQSRTVARIISHPNYDPGTFDNDMALLELSSPVSFTDYVRPVCLAEDGSTFHTGTDSWVTGFGSLSEGGFLANELQEVDVPVVGNRQCSCVNEIGPITSNMICAGLLEGGKDSCQGDSGGPMVSKQGSVWVQLGVVSFGTGCARPDELGVYARVSRYESWITSTITTNTPGFVRFSSSGVDSDNNFTCPGTQPATTQPPTTTAAEPVVCGAAPLNGRIGMGSGLAVNGTWPWQASLHMNGSHVCGGTLISEEYIMTTSQCFSSSNPNPAEWTVYLGRLRQNGSNPFEMAMNVSNITLSNGTGTNVALLKLPAKPVLTDYIQPLCLDLDGTEFGVGTQCWATGWGAGQGGVQQVLQEHQTTIVSCGNGSSSDNICTEPLPLQQGDEGGPLMCKQGDSWIQVAVITVNGSLSRNQANQVFTKTTKFTGFLRANVGSFPPRASSSPTTESPTTTPESSSPSVSEMTSMAALLLPLLLGFLFS